MFLFFFYVNYLAKEPALNFAEHGILLKIQNDKQALSFFNCVPWSDYPQEDERLFIGGYQWLDIVGIVHVPKCKDYEYYVTGMKMFNQCINGMAQANGSKVLSKYSNPLRKLVKERLGIYNKALPTYMTQLFNTMCNAVQHIKLVPVLLNNDFMLVVVSLIISLLCSSIAKS